MIRDLEREALFDEWVLEAKRHGGLAQAGPWKEWLKEKLEEKQRAEEAVPQLDLGQGAA